MIQLGEAAKKREKRLRQKAITLQRQSKKQAIKTSNNDPADDPAVR